MKSSRIILLVFGLGICAAVCQERHTVAPQEAAAHMLKRIDPVYPAMAKELHLQGNVVVQIAISETGTVKVLKAISGHPILIVAALEAVPLWQYSPFLIDGKPLAVQTLVTVPFSLGDSQVEIKRQEEDNNRFFEK